MCQPEIDYDPSTVTVLCRRFILQQKKFRTIAVLWLVKADKYTGPSLKLQISKLSYYRISYETTCHMFLDYMRSS